MHALRFCAILVNSYSWDVMSGWLLSQDCFASDRSCYTRLAKTWDGKLCDCPARLPGDRWRFIVCLPPPAVTTSINGMSALEELRQHPNHYDLVLSDVYMPGGSRSSPSCMHR